MPVNEQTNVQINDEPPKYYDVINEPPPSYGKAMGLRVARAVRNSIRRSVRRFRRNETVTETQNNIPTISSVVDSSVTRVAANNNHQPPQPQSNNFTEMIRSSFRRSRNSTQSREHLVLSDISLADEHVV
jgi:hypothetical protein